MPSTAVTGESDPPSPGDRGVSQAGWRRTMASVRGAGDEPGRVEPGVAAHPAGRGPGMAVIDDVRRLGSELERSCEVYVRGRLKFRVGRLVYVAFSADETVMGFAFPRNEPRWWPATREPSTCPPRRTCASTGSTPTLRRSVPARPASSWSTHGGWSSPRRCRGLSIWPIPPGPAEIASLPDASPPPTPMVTVGGRGCRSAASTPDPGRLGPLAGHGRLLAVGGNPHATPVSRPGSTPGRRARTGPRRPAAAGAARAVTRR